MHFITSHGPSFAYKFVNKNINKLEDLKVAIKPFFHPRPHAVSTII